MELERILFSTGIRLNLRLVEKVNYFHRINRSYFQTPFLVLGLANFCLTTVFKTILCSIHLLTILFKYLFSPNCFPIHAHVPDVFVLVPSYTDFQAFSFFFILKALNDILKLFLLRSSLFKPGTTCHNINTFYIVFKSFFLELP